MLRDLSKVLKKKGRREGGRDELMQFLELWCSCSYLGEGPCHIAGKSRAVFMMMCVCGW